MANIGNIKNKNVDALLNSNNIYYEGGKTLNNIIYPIGSVIIRVDSQNPSYWYGGTWELLCPGRTLVCIDTGDFDFNTVKKTGGEKKHTLLISEMPKHKHVGMFWLGSNSYNMSLNTGTAYPNGYKLNWSGSADDNFMVTGYTGGGAFHNNLQPYMAVYIWVRTK